MLWINLLKIHKVSIPVVVVSPSSLVLSGYAAVVSPVGLISLGYTP